MLNEKADGYRLPSEAEWEYACRAGANTQFCYGNGESLLTGYAVHAASATLPAGSKLPNAWGLFDMHGNVWEWCRDWFGQLPEGTEPVVGKEASISVLRGGCWSNGGRDCRSAARARRAPDYRNSVIGFRLAAVQSSK